MRKTEPEATPSDRAKMDALRTVVKNSISDPGNLLVFAKDKGKEGGREEGFQNFGEISECRNSPGVWRQGGRCHRGGSGI